MTVITSLERQLRLKDIEEARDLRETKAARKAKEIESKKKHCVVSQPCVLDNETYDSSLTKEEINRLHRIRPYITKLTKSAHRVYRS